MSDTLKITKELIVSECETHKNCIDCPLFDDIGDECVFKYPPETWQLLFKREE